jgi:hypothetical protein
MSYSEFDIFDEKIKNILEIRSQHYDESCILMFVFLDFLSKYVASPHPQTDARYNSTNFRTFLKEYSGCVDILRCVQVDKFINDYISEKINKQEYKKYFDSIETKIQEAKSNNIEVPVSQLIDTNSVDHQHLDYFKKITIYNKIYDLRNYAVHSYRNHIQQGIACDEPVLSYTQNIDDEKEGWYNTYVPFEFIYKIVLNCYRKVREEYKGFYNGFFKEDTDFT